MDEKLVKEKAEIMTKTTCSVYRTTSGPFFLLVVLATGLGIAPVPWLFGQVSSTPFQMGLDAASKNNNDEAIANFNLAIKLDPLNAYAYFKRGCVYDQKGNSNQAFIDYTQAIKIDPKIEEAYLSRALIYLERGDYDGAIADLCQAIHMDPQNAVAYEGRGALYLAKGDPGKAIIDFSQAIQLNPKDVDTYNCRGKAYEVMGNPDSALEDYRKAEQIDSKNVDADKNIASLLATCSVADLRDGKKAVEFATKACELSGWKDPEALEILAAACAEVGDFDNAVKWEKQSMATPKLSSKATADAKSRLALYQAHQPYHESSR